MDVDDLLPSRIRKLRHRLVPGEAGAIDEGVDAAVTLTDLRSCGIYRSAVHDIDRDIVDLGRGELGRLVAIGRDDRPTSCLEDTARSKAEAPSSTGDDGDATRRIVRHHVLLD